MIPLEAADDGSVHLAELAAVALVEDEHHVSVIDGVLRSLVDKDTQFLDGGDEYAAVGVLEAAFQFRSVFGGVGSPFLEAVVLQHCLIVEVFSVHHKQHFVHALHAACQLCGLETGQRLAAARGVPYIAARADGAPFAAVARNEDTPEYRLGGAYLVWAHHQ